VAVGDPSTGKGAHIAVCAVFRDEAPYLAEWIEFHRLVGVEHFFLYDDRSADAGREVLAPLVGEGLVTLTNCPMELASGGQGWAYDDALRRARGRFRWLAFIDIDEFVFSPEHESLGKVLAEFEHYAGVVVNWQMYGSSGLQSRSDGLVIESFTRRARTDWVRNRRVKSIVDPARSIRSMGPHFFEYSSGELAVTENEEPVTSVRNSSPKRWLNRVLARVPGVRVDPYAIRQSSVSRVSVSRLRINHYAVRSRQEFAEKLARHSAAGSGPDGTSRLQRGYFAYHDRNEVDDPTLMSYAPRVRERLGQRGSP
jgi:Glycosyltransferase family 92